MIWQDGINGTFQLLGGVFILLHCYRLFCQKKVRGVSLIATIFFASWGIWSLYYYPFLGQWCSFIGGVGIVLAETLYVGMLIYYLLKERRERNERI